MKIKVKDAIFEFELRGNLVYCINKKGVHRCFCGGELLPHNIGIYHPALRGYALDVFFKCVDCHVVLTHGIPEYDIEGFDQNFTRKMVVPVVDDEVRKRLESWGYW